MADVTQMTTDELKDYAIQLANIHSDIDTAINSYEPSSFDAEDKKMIDAIITMNEIVGQRSEAYRDIRLEIIEEQKK